MLRLFARRSRLANCSFGNAASQEIAAMSKRRYGTDGSSPPPDASRAATSDLCDVHISGPIDVITQQTVQVVNPGISNFRNYGGRISFSGRAATVKCFENNPLVKKACEEQGEGRVLVVDGQASHRCALLGDSLSEMAHKNGWNGIIINGCIRDSEDVGKVPFGVKALNTHPIKSSKRDAGMRDVPISFGGVTVRPGDWIYADQDGILVSKEALAV